MNLLITNKSYEKKDSTLKSTIPPTSTKRTMTSHPKLLKHKKTMKYGIRNPDAGLEPAQVVSILPRHGENQTQYLK